MTHNDIAEAIYLSTVGKSEHELSEVLKNAIRMLFRRRLLSKSGAVVSALQKIIYKKNNTVEVLVRSSEPLGHATKALLKAMLEKKYKNKNFVFVESLDSKLLGGFKIQIGDESIDLTLQNKIKQLTEHLTKTHE